jgi:23S rRNA pseudouridine2605 synthase
MLHKPRGFITTMDDEMDRKCVAQLIADVPARVYPVGRLDRDSEGLLLFTNDGAFANAMMHPSRHVPKTYRVTVRPPVTQEQITALTQGVIIDDSVTAPAEVRIVTKEENRVVLEIVLYEGRNRQIRKMCETLDLEVARLRRIAIGSVKLGMLKQGDWRDLTEDEVRRLQLAAGMQRENKTRSR